MAEPTTLVRTEVKCADCSNLYPLNELIPFEDPWDPEGPYSGLNAKKDDILICVRCYNIRMYDCYPDY
ncbi:MAG: hypothetical protein ACXAE3_17325 [Candidatus Kariarchaeaceae archaeon]|jgi:hypothetical protein